MKDQWTPISPDLNTLVIPWLGASSKDEDGRRTPGTLQMIWDSLPQGPIDKAVKKFQKRPKTCFKAEGGYFEHSQWQRKILTFCCFRLNGIIYCVFARTF